MERFDDYAFEDSAAPLTFGHADEPPEFVDTDLHGGEEAAPSAAAERGDHTDDPVRVYLREMGSVSLLTRQAEVDLARRMERANIQITKALSRSPLVRKLALVKYEEANAGSLQLEDIMDLGAQERPAKQRAHAGVVRRFKALSELERELETLQQKLAVTPKDRPRGRARLTRNIVRTAVRASQEIRGIPFCPA